MNGRRFDIVLYGATGFTGRQAVRYFAENAPPGTSWAIAGRDRNKLDNLEAKVPVLVADAADQSAVDRVASQTRILVSTAGPFSLYGDQIVGACVRFRTHYVDITGETLWVRSLIDRYHEQASAEGTRIIPCCGFDCVPCDLGAYWISSQLGRATTEVKAYFQAKGGSPNGGTLATAMYTWESGAVAQMRDPFLLTPGVKRLPSPIENDPQGTHFDSDIDAWVTPWVMGVIDTRVVRRSCAILGHDFAYQEYMKFDGPRARFHASAFAALSAVVESSLRISGLRRLLRRLAPAPGTGPSDREMDAGWFRCDLFARASDGHTVRGLIAAEGDPANRITVKCVCESALVLAGGDNTLPSRAGVLTPSTGLGDALLLRLSKRGIAFTVASVPSLGEGRGKSFAS
jgi:short subunit dehydrogenase-like uncharacterized protein